MLKQSEIAKRIAKINGTDKMDEVMSLLIDKGINISILQDLRHASKDAINLLSDYFEGKTEVAKEETGKKKDDSKNTGKSGNKNRSKKEGKDKDMKDEKSITTENAEPKSDAVVEPKNDVEEAKSNEEAKSDVVELKVETKKDIRKKYKTIDNLVSDATTKETVFEDVRKGSELSMDTIFNCDLNGEQIARMFLDGTLVFDPTMQRGTKADKSGVERANFRETHVKDIAENMKKGEFTPTQIHLAIIEDDTIFEYNADTKELKVDGLVRLLDGQHRTRALTLINQEMMVGDIEDFDLSKYVFNVQIHTTTADFARTIYANLDKNLKLDKSQSRQLASDAYAKIANRLNLESDSPLKGKIATCRPVGAKLVLFNTLAEKLEKIKPNIESKISINEEVEYLKEFFDYLLYKMPEAFGKDEKKRIEFRANNLMNENNFFVTWLKVAYLDKENYKKNIDKMITHKSFYNKDAKVQVTDGGDAYRWIRTQTIKYKQSKDGVANGFAMNNTSSGIDNITNLTFSEILKIK